MSKDSLWEFKKIVIPLDGSKLSEIALKYGVSLANKYKASIVLVSVFSPDDQKSYFKKRIKELDPKLAEDVDKMPLTYLMEMYHGILKDAIKKQGITVKSVLIPEEISTKSVVKVLLNVIEKEKIELVVISSHGKSGFKKLKLGSVTEELIKSLPIPVICVKR